MAILLPALVVGAACGVLAVAAGIYLRRVTGAALTDQFRAAESICAGGFPAGWVAGIEREQFWRRAMRRPTSGTQLALARLDRLVPFFERGSFYEDATARDLLLSQLRQARARWAGMTWEDILRETPG